MKKFTFLVLVLLIFTTLNFSITSVRADGGSENLQDTSLNTFVKSQNLQDIFLNTLRKEHVPVSIFFSRRN